MLDRYTVRILYLQIVYGRTRKLNYAQAVILKLFIQCY